MKRYFYIILSLVVISAAVIALRQTRPFAKDLANFDSTSFRQYERAKVTALPVDERLQIPNGTYVKQQVELRLLTGEKKGQTITTTNEVVAGLSASQIARIGQTVVLGVLDTESGGVQYTIVDQYRLPALLVALLFFIVVVLVVAGRQGVGAIAGLIFIVVVLSQFVAPQLLAGTNALLVIIPACLVMTLYSMILAHGYNRETMLAIISTLAALMLAIVVSMVAVSLTRLFGYGSADSAVLSFGYQAGINMRGILLAGIIIGTLGILDDVTTSQTEAVAQLRAANENFGIRDLFIRAMAIGRHHIASLVNTLVLAYAGASLPLFLLFFLNQADPWWVILNSEFMAEEIVRTIVGSSTLILAVPLATIISARFGKRVVALK
jgi:uncharacterized membrane protein